MLTTTRQERFVHIPFRRTLMALPLVVLSAVVCIDAGSCALVHLQAEDDAGEAGRAAVAAVQFESAATSENAQRAYQAAASVAELHRQQIDRETFTMYADGSIELTVRRTAPTLLFKHLPGLRELAHSEITLKQSRPNW